jgi:hypothetical protein
MMESRMGRFLMGLVAALVILALVWSQVRFG